MNFNKKEKLFISALLLILYLIPASLDWMRFEKELFSVVLVSLPIWLVFFFIGPFWLFYALQKVKFVAGLHVVGQGALYVGIMVAGAHVVSRLHIMAFPHYRFPLQEQFLSAFLWGVFIFSMTQMYLLYLRFTEEKRLRKEAQWADLTSRLNPHFLFNSLNTISALIHSAPQQADDILHTLADILRYSVDQQHEWVPLEQELSICKTYLSIEKARFTENLNIHWHISESLDPALYKVPPLLLQPLIENVTKHVKKRPIELHISVAVENGELDFSVQDNGKGFSKAVLNDQFEAGQGLNIVKKRVAIAGGSLALYNNSADTLPDQGGAVCAIKLPVNPCA